MGSQNSICRNSIDVIEESTSSKKSAIRSTVDEDAKVVGLVAKNSESRNYDPNAQSSFTSADESFIQAKGKKEQTKTRPGRMVSYNTIIVSIFDDCN